MKIDVGRLYAVIGKNGCGKSTLMNQLFQKYYNHQIIYIKQNHFLIDDLNIEENLKFCHYQFQDFKINSILNIDKIKKLYPSQVSLGQRQMIAVICALYSQNQFIIFDETLSGLNKEHLFFLLELCKKHAISQKKTFFIVTHQKEVIHFCDKKINFDEGIPQIQFNDIQIKQRKKVRLKDVFVYQERHWMRHLVCLIVLVLCFLFISLTSYYRNRIYNDLNTRITENYSTETFIVNNTDIYHPYHQYYDIYYSSISKKELNKLKNIKGLNHFQPFIPFSIECKRTKNNKPYYDPIYLIQGNHIIKKNLILDSQYSINPYTSYSRMEDSIRNKTSHNNGLVLNSWFCKELGIKEKNLENTKLKLNISVPVSQTSTKDGMQVIVSDESEKINQWRDIKGREIQYKEFTLTFPIKGILKEESPFIERQSCFAYLDQKIMQSIFNKVNKNYVPNAYFSQIQDIESYKEIQKEVEKISSTLEFHSIYNYYQISDSVSNFVQMLSFISTIPLCLLLIIVVYTTIIQKKSRLYFYEQLLSYGYHLKMCFDWIIKKYIVDICLFTLFYFGLFYLCNMILNQINYPNIDLQLYIFIFPIVLLCFIPMGVDIYALRKEYTSILGLSFFGKTECNIL